MAFPSARAGRALAAFVGIRRSDRNVRLPGSPIAALANPYGAGAWKATPTRCTGQSAPGSTETATLERISDLTGFARTRSIPPALERIEADGPPPGPHNFHRAGGSVFTAPKLDGLDRLKDEFDAGRRWK
jgi:hypothetical protein